jgi:ABC-2 type transport system ATP-binding protein
MMNPSNNALKIKHVAIAGNIGAGKTTLLHLLSGLRFPWVGSCEVLGEEARKRKLKWQQQVLFVPETIEMPALKLPQWLKQLAPFYPAFDQQLFDDILLEFELEVQDKLNELSYGQQKKVMLAFAIATRVKLLLLDEPSNGLDIFSKAQLRKVWTRYLADDALVVISTHQVRELGTQFDRVVLIDAGKVCFNLSTEALAAQISIQRSTGFPDQTAWYSESIPGGYVGVYPAEIGNIESEIDLELLMKAVAEKPEIIHYLQKDLHHAE